ncbi:hypothetical protein H6503_05060 [Candidatus Woesearchaeota archaeon]|nr:hypothetical protein [Candidatus Woesearchaeota archaeon]
MAYITKLDATRGFMIESGQPFTKLDLELVKHILDEKDEVVIGIGDAGRSHDKGHLMTAGEVYETIDFTLRIGSIDPNRYCIIPIENNPNNFYWVAETRMLTPRWDTYYTRNFKNFSMMSHYADEFGFDCKAIEKQKPEKDYFAELLSGKIITEIPNATNHMMSLLGIIDRADTIYNRVFREPKSRGKERTLFLGGFQPVTGVFDDYSGHLGVMHNILDANQLVVPIGSGQHSHMMDDPLTAGARIEIIRYVLQNSGIDSSKFSLIPIKNVEANVPFASKVRTLCPEFNKVMAGNDWTKQLFGNGNYEIVPLTRKEVKGSGISGTRVRNTIYDELKKVRKEDIIPEECITAIESGLEGIIDPLTFEALKHVGGLDIMHFLAHAKE